ncbi:hypothetical protein J5U21_00781 [Saccharolobus shibatae]|uniref:Uncharacterized protein n=1 Tax=Saccharolobus shibatae TaxID=2286 RepID=A0A8F5BTE1_9CREN|nr:hypothetical protein J5U21_00781 [Saccharolobus shibatae]
MFSAVKRSFGESVRTSFAGQIVEAKVLGLRMDGPLGKLCSR